MKKFVGIGSAIALLILMQATSMAAVDDLSKPIRVSADGRYLATADGKPFFWLADTAWPMFVRLDRHEADRYLQDRAAKGFTVIQAVVTGGPWDFHAANRHGDEPYVGGDPSKPNPKYFEHVDWIVDRAAQHGLRLALVPTWGAATIAGHKFEKDVFNEKNARAYSAWLGARYRNKGVIWILGGDTLSMSPRGLDSPGPDGRRKAIIDARPIYDAMAAGIEAGQGREAFITYHPCGCSYYGVGEPRTSVFFGNRDWLDMNMIQSSHFENPKLLSKWGYRFNWDSRRNYEAIAAEYASEPVRPVVDGEPHYEGIPHDGGKLGWSAYDTRNSAYHALFAGAAGHTFGNNSIHQLFDPSRTKASSAAKTPWWIELDSAGSQLMGHVKALFLSRPYFSRIPDQSLVRGSIAVGTGFVSATRDRNGAYLMVYSPQGEPVEVDLNQLSGSAVAWWFDPRTGESTQLDGKLPHNRWHVFEPPSRGPDQDWILVVDDAGGGFGPPGRVEDRGDPREVTTFAPEESVDDSMATNVRGTVISDQVRHLPFEGAANFRDLGGYVAAGGKRIRQGLLYRSDALDSLSAVDMKLLAQLNIGRITDFRSTGEVEKRPDHLPAELEARYIHMPLGDPLAANRSQRAKEIDAAGAEFRRALSLTNEEEKVAIIDRLIVDHYYPRLGRDGRAAYSRWLRGLLDTPKGSAQVFHCTGGADRTGFAAAILLFALGVPKEQILDDYLLTNRYFFSPRGLALLESKGMPAMPSSYRLSARYLEASFKAIENDYGSLDNYLRQGLGIDDETRRELRDRYLESPAPRDSGALQRFREGSPMAIAHRACWQGGPENSLSSLESCVSEGIDAAEIDIRLTKDNQLILLHDDDLSRTTSASGPVGTFSLAELRHAKLRSGKGGAASRLTNEGLPTFAEALRVAKGRLILFLDIKCGGCAEMVANVVEAEGARDWVIFIGGMENRHLAQMQWVREQTLTWISDCQLRALLTANTRCASSFIEGYNNRPATLGRTFLVMSQEDARFLSGVAENPALRQVGIVAGENATSESQLHQDEVLTELQKQWQLLLEAGVTAIITDYPVELHQILGNAAVQVHRE